MPDLFVPLDVNTPDDPKVMAVGDHAELVFYRALCLVKRLGTDGFVASQQLSRNLGGKPADAKRLCDAGLWEPVGGGWVITAWLKRNPPQAELDEKKAEHAERMRKWRDAKEKRSRDAAVTDQGDGHERDGGASRDANVRSVSESEVRVKSPPGGAVAPSEPSSNGQGDTTQRLVAGFVVDWEASHHGNPPPSKLKAIAGKAVKELLAEGYDPDDLAKCLGVAAKENKSPANLALILGDLHSREPT